MAWRSGGLCIFKCTWEKAGSCAVASMLSDSRCEKCELTTTQRGDGLPLQDATGEVKSKERRRQVSCRELQVFIILWGLHDNDVNRGLSAYELDRLARITANKAAVEALGGIAP